MHLRQEIAGGRRLSVPSAREFGSATDSTRRMRHVTVAFGICLALVFARVLQLELSEGSAFRAAAARPFEKARPLPGVRGTIVSRDGQILACDRRLSSLAVHYRYLEESLNLRWLRSQARARVPHDAPQRSARIATELAYLQTYRNELPERLARLCGRPVDELRAQGRKVRARVQGISQSVNQAQARRLAERSIQPADDLLGWNAVAGYFPAWVFAPADDRTPPRIVVAEELDYHVLVADIPLEVVAEVESRPELYPGVRIVEQSARRYPLGATAGNLVGHVGNSPAGAGETQSAAQRRDGTALVGRQGVERQFEAQLCGRDGLLVDLTNHGGHLLSSYRRSAPTSGQEIQLTIDLRAQRLAEEQLDRALAASSKTGASPKIAAGGAILILDVVSGEILAAATAPRYNPNVFATPEADAVARLLADPAHPLFDRVTQMALPPGSVFKIVSALALLDRDGFDPDAPFACQGFLEQPDRLRCQIFRRYGLGHGAVDLTGALTQSCNVYFFHHAKELGAAALDDWGQRLGFGQPTGVDLPGEAAGFLPGPMNLAANQSEWTTADTLALSIGQSTLRTTPLQVGRLMAAIANGGFLVTPHIRADSECPRPSISGLKRQNLERLQHALTLVANDPTGTAYATLADTGVTVAGKTGTAETGATTPDHAWFAGYAPAQAPRVAFVVALEHQGSSERAAAVTKELVQGLAALGLLGVP